MQLTRACISILDQLEDMVERLSDDDFVRPCETLNKVTIGQHLRHTIEFFLCLEKGFSAGVINYDNREHDKLMETDRAVALAALARVRSFVNHSRTRPLQLEVGYERNSDTHVTIDTNYLRELSYNIEHAVHHMAIMKIGLKEVAAYVPLPDDFGIAVSTLRHAESTART